MVNVVETIFGIAIGAGLVWITYAILSRKGGDKAVKYQPRIRRARIVALTALVLGVVGEILLFVRR